MKTRQKVVIAPEAEGVLVAELFKRQVPDGVWVLKNPKHVVHNHSYGGVSRFFEGLTQGKIFETFCPRCCINHGGALWLPPRVDCPDCWGKMGWFEIDVMGRGATVYSHSVTNLPGAGFKGTVPCPLISVEIPGVCTKMMSYLSEFGEGEPYIGMPIRPVFRTERPTRTILDLSWIPID